MERIRQPLKKYLFLVSIFSPVITGVVRKSLPGQPFWIEGIPALTPILLITIDIGILKEVKKIPLMLLFQIVLILFAGASFAFDYRIGIGAFFTRVIPIMYVYIWFKYVKKNDLEKISRILAWISILHLPMIVISLIFGSKYLPGIFRPIDSLYDAGKNMRSGVSVFSGVFSTQWIMSVSMLITVFMCLATMSYGNKKLKYWGLISSILMIYLSTRRAVFFISIIALGIFVILGKIKFGIKMAILVTLSVALIAINQYEDSGMRCGGYTGRLHLYLDLDNIIEKRLEDVFMERMIYWTENKPLGSYLGFAGPEGRAFRRGKESEHVEVGGALMVAEIGIIPTIIFTLLLLTMITKNIIKNIGKGRRSDLMLNLLPLSVFGIFFLKALFIMANVTLCQIFFWGILGYTIKRQREIEFEYKT